MRELTSRQSECLRYMIDAYESMGRLPKRYEVAEAFGVHPTRISHIWSKLARYGYIGMKPLEILRDETGRRVSVETIVTVRRRGA